MQKTRVSVVSYLNSKPFLYGLKKSFIADQIDVSVDIPSDVAAKLIRNHTDVGLIPVGALADLQHYQLIGDFCIGAHGNVRTVVLASNVPFNEIDTILLDYQSRTSVILARVLSHFFWKKNFNFKHTSAGFENDLIRGNNAGVVIGDRVFTMEKKYCYTLDLSEEWINFTKLPFVFAVWAANKNVSEQFKKNFNLALDLGIKNISEIVKQEQANYPDVNINDYFSKNINFILDEKKKEGMNKFLELSNKLPPVN
jgi:chorismate dehydratase